MTQTLWMGGVLNFTDPLIGWPFYIWLWVMILVFAGISWLGWRYGKWEPYKPFWGLYDAFKAESNACIIFNLDLILEVISERSAKCIFDYSQWSYEGLNWFQAKLFNYASVFLENMDTVHGLLYKLGGRNFDCDIARKLQNYEWESTSSCTSGGIHCDIILDADRWSVRSSPQHAIVERTAEQWNDANPTDQIHSYPKFQRLLNEGVLQCPEGIEPTVMVTWNRIDQAFPLNMANNEASGPVREIALEMENEDATAVSRYYLPVLFGGMGFGILMYLIRFVIHMIGH